MPPLVIVNVPRCISSIVSCPSRARLPNSPIVFSIPATESWSASRTTGTTSPFSVPTAMPTW